MRSGSGQADLFGAPEPASPRRRAGRPKAVSAAPDAPPASPAAVKVSSGEVSSGEVSVEVLAERVTAAELDALAAALPDDALAHLVLAGARQLRRRLVRVGANAGGRLARVAKGRGASSLERAARQLAAEMGGVGEGEET